MRGSFVRIEGTECVGETSAAINVMITSGQPHVWIPKSQVHDDSEVYERGGTGALIITRWIAEQKDIEEEGEEYES